MLPPEPQVASVCYHQQSQCRWGYHHPLPLAPGETDLASVALGLVSPKRHSLGFAITGSLVACLTEQLPKEKA